MSPPATNEAITTLAESVRHRDDAEGGNCSIGDLAGQTLASEADQENSVFVATP